MIGIYDNTSGEMLFIVEDASNYDLTGRSTVTVPDDYPDAWRWDKPSRSFVQDFSVMHGWMFEAIEKAIADDIIAYEATLQYSKEEFAEYEDLQKNGLIYGVRQFAYPKLHDRWIASGKTWDTIISEVRSARDVYEATKFFAVRELAYHKLTIMNDKATTALKKSYFNSVMALSTRLYIIDAETTYPPIVRNDESLKNSGITRIFLPRTTTTTPTLIGMTNTVAGTVTNPGQDNSAFVTTMPRLCYTATTAVPRCSWTHNSRELSFGFLDKFSGFQFGIRWRFVNWENGARFFAGLVPQQTAVTTATSLTKVCGALFENFGTGNAENALSLIIRDDRNDFSRSVYSRNNTDSVVAANNILPATNDVFDLRITRSPGSKVGEVSIKGPGAITVDFPFYTSELFCPQFYIDKGTATNDVAIEVYKIWITIF